MGETSHPHDRGPSASSVPPRAGIVEGSVDAEDGRPGRDVWKNPIHAAIISIISISTVFRLMLELDTDLVGGGVSGQESTARDDHRRTITITIIIIIIITTATGGALPPLALVRFRLLILPSEFFPEAFVAEITDSSQVTGGLSAAVRAPFQDEFVLGTLVADDIPARRAVMLPKKDPEEASAARTLAHGIQGDEDGSRACLELSSSSLLSPTTTTATPCSGAGGS